MPSLPFRLSFSLSASPFLFRPAFGLRFRFVSVSFLCLLGLLFRFRFRFRSQCIRKGKETTQAATRNETGPRGKAEAIWADTGRGGRGGGQSPFRTLRTPRGLPIPHFVHSFQRGGCIPLLPDSYTQSTWGLLSSFPSWCSLSASLVPSFRSLPWSFRSLRAGKGLSVRSKGEWGAFLRKEMSFLSGKKCTFREGSFIREKG